ncbi:MAG: BatA and WFA domain-containing protein [bacterium]|nr:BatA and WFA domain-containing protein [bacterium]
MSWINMLSPLQWLLMLSVPPLIVMLYFLKLRRVPVEVPSTYLWQRAIEDLHVNSIWQRLRKNLLLWLQLLVVAALILACLRPGFRGEETLGDRSIFVIDNSASMQATDLDRMRLEDAKSKALEMINALDGNDVGMVIAFADGPDIRQGFTSDKNRLREAINSLQPTNRTTDLNEALRAASGLANPGRTSQIEDLNDIQVAEAMPATLYIFSDGGFNPPQIDLGNLQAEYIAIGQDSPNNVAIVAFTAERNAENEAQIEAFAMVENFGLQPVTATASLSLNGELIDASEVTLDPASSTGVSFAIRDLNEGALRLELEVDDDLPLDNVAYAGLDPPRQLEVVLVSEGNPALEAALATDQAMALASVRIVEPASLNSEEVQQLAQSGSVDLFIYDACSPETMPEANTMFIGSLPPGNQWQAAEPTGPLFVLTINNAHPMLQFVDLDNVRIVQGSALSFPSGGTELVRTDAGVLLAVAPREAYQDAVLSMEFAKRTDDGIVPNTDWPIKRSFPVFVLNALEYLGGAVASSGSKTVRPGQPAILNLASRFDAVEITDPSGKKSKLERSGGPQLIFTQTDQLGFYEARPVGSDRLLQLFTVNLFSDQESNLSAAAEVQIGAESVASRPNQQNVVRIEYWRWLLALAVMILSVEWYVYNRRIAV